MHKLAYIINFKFNPYYAFKGFASSTRGGTGNTVVPVGTDYTASLRSQTVIYSVICFIILTVTLPKSSPLTILVGSVEPRVLILRK